MERFYELKRILSLLKIPFKVNKKLVRGLDYYCHTAFEIVSDQLGAQATVCGGGRYDGLVEQLGGNPTSSIGWAIGMERLLIILDQALEEKVFPDVYLVNKGNDASIDALCLARNLRAENFIVELDNSGAAFSKQFKRANRSCASWAIVIGDDEVSKGGFRLKSLNSEKEEDNEIFLKKSDLSKLISMLKA